MRVMTTNLVASGLTAMWASQAQAFTIHPKVSPVVDMWLDAFPATASMHTQ